jgi:hypothetical protein
MATPVIGGRDCHIEYGEKQGIYEECRIAELESHPQVQRFRSFTASLDITAPGDAAEQLENFLGCAEPGCRERKDSKPKCDISVSTLINEPHGLHF